MSELVSSQEWKLSGKGLKILNPDLSYEDFEGICTMLGDVHAAIKFAIGDAILLGEEFFGDRVYQAAERMNLSEENKRECVRVSMRVPYSRRRQGVSWSHHRAVAALEPAEQKTWLKHAAEEGLSHQALRDELRNGAEPRAQSHCRCCGRALP